MCVMFDAFEFGYACVWPLNCSLRLACCCQHETVGHQKDFAVFSKPLVTVQDKGKQKGHH